MMLDTTALIDLTRSANNQGHQRVTTALNHLMANGTPLCKSRINEAEFRVGAFRSANPAAEMAKVNRVLSTLVMLEFDALAADQFARLQASQLNTGIQIGGPIDRLIAAIAIVNSQSLLTRNGQHFAGVAGLPVVPY